MDDAKLVVINALMKSLDQIVDCAGQSTDDQSKVRDMKGLAQDAIARYQVPVGEFNGTTKP